nr:phosphopantetheine-binding protein [Kibdelosporangium sp. MJ126-NF4]CEL14434.1 hypothetical protein [Kibdelosporangium sp. MJ126-NF4]CTQ88799.1 hypothetical protein [Kibdelosporangium sp. MJ126-NF4]
MSDQQTADVNLADADERLEIVRSVWREVLGVTDVADDVTFFDQGGDSLRLVMLVERLNQTTGRALKTIDLFRAGTVRGHSDLLRTSDNPATTGFRGTTRSDLINAARSRKPQ